MLLFDLDWGTLAAGCSITLNARANEAPIIYLLKAQNSRLLAPSYMEFNSKRMPTKDLAHGCRGQLPYRAV